jgi:hypothetical protein
MRRLKNFASAFGPNLAHVAAVGHTLGILGAFSAPACAQDLTPRIGTIEIYGTRKIPEKKILDMLGVREGSPLPASRADAELRLVGMRGVALSHLEAVCCDDAHRMILYIGVEEREAPHMEFHAVPSHDVELPPDLMEVYQDFLERAKEASRDGTPSEDLTSGYSLMTDFESRADQIQMQTMAEDSFAQIHDVVRNSADEEQRAAAAYILQYSKRAPRVTKQMIDDLQYALSDNSEVVRSTAMRSLKAVAVGGKLHPEQDIDIQPTWYVELLNSVVWSDRRSAALALVEITQSRNQEALALMRERAMPSLVEMARWKDLAHALPPFILTGRIAGLSEQEIRDAWVAGNRELVIKKALATVPKQSLPDRLLKKVGA